MSDNCWIGNTGVTLYVGDKEVSFATLGDKLIFPLWEGTYKVGYTGSGTIQILNNGFNLDKIVYMQIGDIQMYPQTTYDFGSQTKEVIWKVKVSSTSLVESMFSGLATVTGATAMSNTDRFLPFQFYQCPNLTNVDLGNIFYVETAAFYECSGLTTTTNGYNLAFAAESAFRDCRNLVSPPIANTIIDRYAYNRCISFTGTLTIPDSVVILGDYAFDACHISGLTIGSGITTIGVQAFANCRQLSGHVVIPNNVTEIKRSAFVYCDSYTALTLGTGVATIGDAAFCYNTSLNVIYLDTTNTVTLGNNAFLQFSFALPGTFYYHSGTDITAFQAQLPTWTFTTY